jgi:hypothetical protein
LRAALVEPVPAPTPDGFVAADIGPRVTAKLERAGVDSLERVRRLATAQRLARKTGIAEGTADKLLTSAALRLADDRPAVARALAADGAASLADVAATPVAELAARLPGLEPAEVERARGRARALSSIVGNRVVELAGGREALPAVPPDAQPTASSGLRSSAAGLTGTESCAGCRECASALSPSAYLLELVDFLHDCFGLTLEQLDARFQQGWASLPLECANVEETVLQARIAIEVLERTILAAEPGWDRTRLYDELRSLPAGGDPPARPGVLDELFDGYLSELGITRGEIAAAVAQGGQALADLATRLRLPEADVTSLNVAAGSVTIAAVDRLPGLIRKARTAGIDGQADPEALAGAEREAAAAIGRVEATSIPPLRDTLVVLAARRTQWKSRSALAAQLHIDLASGGCDRTSRVAQAIATAQSLVNAYLLGREQLPGARFDAARWGWLRSYGSWHAARMVYLYPENFALSRARRSQTPPFRTLAAEIGGGDATPRGVHDGVARYAEGIRTPSGDVRVRAACALHGSTYIFTTTSDAVYISAQAPEGDWQGWRRLGAPGSELVEVVAFDERLYLFFKSAGAGKLRWATLDPREVPPLGDYKLELKESPDLGAAFAIVDCVVASGDRLTVYFRSSWASDDLFSVRTDGSGRWSSVRGAIMSDGRVPVDTSSPDQFNPFRAVGHVGGSDYLLKAGSGRIWLVRLKHPDYDAGGWSVWVYDIGPSVESWTELAPVDTSPAYAGTVRDGKLVVYVDAPTLQPIGGGSTALSDTRRIAELDPSAPGIAIAWVDLAQLEHDEPLLGLHGGIGGGNVLETAGDALLLYTPSAYVGFVLTPPKVTALAIGFTGLWLEPAGMWPGAPLRPHPVGEGVDATEDFRAFQRTIYGDWDPLTPGAGPRPLRWTPPGEMVRLLLDEWYLHVPLLAADALRTAGFYEEAIDWLHVVFFPYRQVAAERLVHGGLTEKRRPADIARAAIAWLRDPFEAHALARLRKGAYLRSVVLAYVGTLLDWADQLFARDTRELIDQARELYELALDLIGSEELTADLCAQELREVQVEVVRRYGWSRLHLLEPLRDLDRPSALRGLRRVRRLLADAGEPNDGAVAAIVREIHADSGADRDRQTVASAAEWTGERRRLSIAAERLAIAELPDELVEGLAVIPLDEWVPEVARYPFCVPANPLPGMLRLHASANLQKIRSCRNFAGMKRSLDLYAAPLEAGAAAGEAPPAVASEPPPLYRYGYLIERARYFVGVAQQIEGSVLSTLEKQDAERYNLLRARQDLRVAQASEELYELRQREAWELVDVGTAQIARARTDAFYFSSYLQAGLSGHEQSALFYMRAGIDLQEQALEFGDSAAILSAATSIIGWLTGSSTEGGVGGVVGAGVAPFAARATLAGSRAQLESQSAAYERRVDEWRRQVAVAQADEAVARESREAALAHTAVADKEREIAALTTRNADDMVTFLTTKFTNLELYEWMEQTLRRLYRAHIDFAVAVARMAQQALSFERQAPINIIRQQYWDPGHKDLLAAEGLLLDLNRLDQHRLTTERRRRELTKTISLATMAPVELAELRTTGVTQLATPMSWFDRDFPGHYMRLVKSVNVSFIGLLPAVDAVHATLVSSGISRVVTDPNGTGRALVRPADAVALTAPLAATGLFEVDLRDDLLLPFEGTGVDTTWGIELPKGANRFDFDSLVDVLLTISYTALEDRTYREQVLDSLGADANGRVPVETQSFLSARYGYPDDWYHFKNPVFVAGGAYGWGAADPRPPYAWRFRLGRDDLPSNEEGHALRRVLLAVEGKAPGRVPFEVTFEPDGGGAARSVQADIVDGRARLEAGTGFAIAGQTPFGTWTVRLRNEAGGAAYAPLRAGSTMIEGQRSLALDWLADLFLLFQYEATVQYPR